jgi:hypothetical protein
MRGLGNGNGAGEVQILYLSIILDQVPGFETHLLTIVV